MGRARAEDPLGKVLFFTKLASAVPTESGVVGRSDRLAVNTFQNGYMISFIIRLVCNQYLLNGKIKDPNYIES
ncbi:hypothetical protein GI584_08255 [Gracilibacillus salitolerans]|uniref:Uncharacterized protein n=1 Tax=Gracilibacillus salitolerans TaxID=2663022 RepID=A0A5Q2TH37_9BACI|nr:hypothetical protein GI584_08255 [Gracilibacillus salitolerans]